VIGVVGLVVGAAAAVAIVYIVVVLKPRATGVPPEPAPGDGRVFQTDFQRPSVTSGMIRRPPA
jgi:hypothetical protein